MIGFLGQFNVFKPTDEVCHVNQKQITQKLH